MYVRTYIPTAVTTDLSALKTSLVLSQGFQVCTDWTSPYNVLYICIWQAEAKELFELDLNDT